jgi:hypothetical protein
MSHAGDAILFDEQLTGGVTPRPSGVAVDGSFFGRCIWQMMHLPPLPGEGVGICSS